MFKPEVVKLPATMPDGTRTTKHPLLYALNVLTDLGFRKADLARALEVKPQTLHVWIMHAKDNRHFLLPAEQVPALSKMTGIAPHFFRPDLWPNPKWVF